MSKLKDIVDLPFPEREIDNLETFDYSKSLELIKEGKKVSCLRWGIEGNVYVMLIEHSYYVKNIGYKERKELILYDAKRDTMVNFVPSVENQLEDKWYEVNLNE